MKVNAFPFLARIVKTIRRKERETVLCLVLVLSGCARDPKFDQYFVQGEKLYLQHCSNCHQKDRKGLGLLYPPLDESDYMSKNFKETLCLMKYGISGELIVNGKSYNQPMPGVRSLTDLEVAEIATYIYNSGQHKRGLILVKDVEKIMRDCDQ
jgi:mono/diheme cytochrome c family protein